MQVPGGRHGKLKAKAKIPHFSFKCTDTCQMRVRQKRHGLPSAPSR